ncbi:MAG: hypothetical protein JSU05_13350 [Bacteroidetes bacterium]|nr:hypothetical protein [Bacteroidota bacterium]
MIDTLEIVGVILIFKKILIHVYIRSWNDRSFNDGIMSGNLSFLLLLPVFDDLPKKWLKIFCNIIYVAGLALIVIFLIFNDSKKG